MTRAVRFVLIGLVAHVILAVAYAKGVAAVHDARRQDAKWLLGPHEVELMVAGDSHARFAVEAPLLGYAINVAVPGEHYQKSQYRVPWLLDHGTRAVEAVLLPFDAASFSSFKSDSFEPERVWGRYVDWWELGARKGDRFAYAGKWAKSELAPYVGELETVLQFVTSSRHFRDPTDPRSSITLTVFEDGPTVARRHFAGADPFDPDMVWAFRRLLGDLEERGIRVVLVRYPVTAGYTTAAEGYGATRALRDRLFAEVGQPGVVDQIDLEDALVGQPQFFGDADHLSVVGKRQLTRLLARELVLLGLDVRSPP
jgi:hypothetical protein